MQTVGGITQWCLELDKFKILHYYCQTCFYFIHFLIIIILLIICLVYF